VLKSAVFWVITRRRVVITQKTADIINTAAEAWNQGVKMFKIESSWACSRECLKKILFCSGQVLWIFFEDNCRSSKENGSCVFLFNTETCVAKCLHNLLVSAGFVE
jgi:hypothetical protein